MWLIYEPLKYRILTLHIFKFNNSITAYIDKMYLYRIHHNEHKNTWKLSSTLFPDNLTIQDVIVISVDNSEVLSAIHLTTAVYKSQCDAAACFVDETCLWSPDLKVTSLPRRMWQEEMVSNLKCWLCSTWRWQSVKDTAFN